MSLIFLDIETRPNKKYEDLYEIEPNKLLKDPAKIAEDIEKKEKGKQKLMACDPDFNEIVCIGLKPLGEKPFTLTLPEFAEWLPQKMTAKVGTWDAPVATTNAGRRFVTFNGKNFDFPTIIKAGIREGLDMPYNVFLKACDKYRADNHIDLMEKLPIVWGQAKSLDKYMRIYLGIQKETLGDEFFRNATDKELIKHCLQDLEYTEQLFNKFKPLFV